MDEQAIFILADRALEHVVSQIKDDQWDMKLPEWFETGRDQDDLTLRKIINYHAYDEAWVPDVLDGKMIDEVGEKFDGDLLGSDPRASYAKLVESAIQAVEAIEDPEEDVHLSYGDFPTSEYLKHVTSFRGFRSYDIARLIGVDTTLPPKLVQGMWDELSPEIEEWRKLGVYGPPVPVASDAPLQARLLGMSGRNPNL
jgi:uncharacterized protein (TIGR03086 family)